MKAEFIDLLENGQNLRETNPNEALNFFEEAYRIALSSGDQSNQLEALFELGVTKHDLSLHSEAADHFKKALGKEYIHEDLYLKSNILRCLAVQYIRLNKIEEAIHFLYESERVSISCGYDENLHMIESTLGSIYIQLKMFEKALEHELRSLELAKKMNSEPMTNYSYLGIGSCYYLMGDLHNAEIYLNNATRGEQTNYTKANTCYYLSKLYFDKKDNMNSLRFADEGIAVSEKYLIHDYHALCTGMKGSIFLESGESAAAISFLEDAIRISEKIENKRIYFSLYKDLIRAYEITGDYRKKAEAYGKLYEYHIEYLENQSKLKIKQLNTQHQIEKARDEAEIERLKNVELREALDNVKKLNGELELLNMEKNEFMAIAVHDLKNPLQNILSTARLIKRSSPSESVSDLSENIVQQTDRMFNLIRKLLDHNIAEEGKIKISKSEFRAETVMRDIMNDYKEAAGRKQLNLNFVNHCNGNKLCTDYDILYQIMCNLVSNAIKFSPNNKNIFLGLASENGWIEYEVRDEGPGFSEEDKKKMYRKFSKLSARPTMGESSTGLGLAIAKKLSKLINAELQLESEPGRGAKFRIIMNTA